MRFFYMNRYPERSREGTIEGAEMRLCGLDKSAESGFQVGEKLQMIHLFRYKLSDSFIWSNQIDARSKKLKRR